MDWFCFSTHYSMEKTMEVFQTLQIYTLHACCMHVKVIIEHAFNLITFI